MKREGHLIQRVADPENLRLAFWKASRSRRGKLDVCAYREALDMNLARLREEILSGTVVVGRYRYFTVHDPKKRTICAASFEERVLHHALMNVCGPVFEWVCIDDTFACRLGRGQSAAIQRAQDFARQWDWFLKRPSGGLLARPFIPHRPGGYSD